MSNRDPLNKIITGRVHKEGTLLKEASSKPNSDDAAAVIKERKPRKIRYAVLMAYQGKDYYGMQIQLGPHGLPTIESEFMSAMIKIGMLTKELMEKPIDFEFQRAARTDKSVSAVRQVVSMWLPLNQEFLDNGHKLLNVHLPRDIRVISIRRAAPSFNSWKTCDARTYSYTIPTFAFASYDELTSYNYRISLGRVREINEILDVFVGTHNFYNFTSQREHSDNSCKRYIISFKCDGPYIYNSIEQNTDVEFITLYIKGQSFMLHQIRKMIGITIAVIRNFMYKSDLQRAFEDERMDVPRAPGLGLLLEQLHFENYDSKFKKTHPTLDDWGEQVETEVKNVRRELIVERILFEECATNSMMNWLQSLTLHKFSCNPEDPTSEASVSKLFNAKLIAEGQEVPCEGEDDDQEHNQNDLEMQDECGKDYNVGSGETCDEDNPKSACINR